MADPDSVHAGHTKRLLVVDDDPSVREMLVRVLETDGYMAWPAANGNQAQSIMAAVPIDLALLDLGLPGKDGWETFDALRHEKPGLPVIIITARTNQRAHAESAGANALFEKPLDFAELLRAVAQLVAEPSRTRNGERARPTIATPTPRAHGAL